MYLSVSWLLTLKKSGNGWTILSGHKDLWPLSTQCVHQATISEREGMWPFDLFNEKRMEWGHRRANWWVSTSKSEAQTSCLSGRLLCPNWYLRGSRSLHSSARRKNSLPSTVCEQLRCTDSEFTRHFDLLTCEGGGHAPVAPPLSAHSAQEGKATQRLLLERFHIFTHVALSGVAWASVLNFFYFILFIYLISTYISVQADAISHTVSSRNYQIGVTCLGRVCRDLGGSLPPT